MIKQRIKLLLQIIPILGMSLLVSCGKESDDAIYEIPEDPIVENKAVLMFADYSTAPHLLKGIDGHGSSACVTIISNKQPTTTISKAWGVKCDIFKSPNRKDEWHCLISVPENAENIQRHAILSLHNDNKTIKVKLNQNTNDNVEYGWVHMTTEVTNSACDFHTDQAATNTIVASDSEDVTTGNTCSSCNGSALCQSCYLTPGSGECKYCKGRGRWQEMIWTIVTEQYCNICDWTGKCTDCVGSGVCPTCYGIGIIDNKWNN